MPCHPNNRSFEVTSNRIVDGRTDGCRTVQLRARHRCEDYTWSLRTGTSIHGSLPQHQHETMAGCLEYR
jgi:hypothetical protein